jgi:copper(I)-binding protein
MSEQQTSYKTSTDASNNGNAASKDSPNKPKKARKLVGIPSVNALSSMINTFYQGHIAKDPVSWEAIENYQIYALAPDGSHLMMKVSRSKSVDLKTRRSLPTAYGQAYPVEISTNPTDPKSLY